MPTAIGDVRRRCYEKGWITTRAGNISMTKREGKYLYITPSGSRKMIVHPEHVIKLEIVFDPQLARRFPEWGAEEKLSSE